jgi:hypothetical protein
MRFKSVIFAIVFIFISSAMAIITYVQTKSFGNLLTKVISDISEKNTDTRISLNKVKISVFPPGIEMLEVSIDKDFQDGKRIHAELGKIGFYVSLIEIEERKLAFGEITISDSIIDYKYPHIDNDRVERIEQNLIDDVFNYSDRLPIKIDRILLENTRIHANHDLLNIRRLKLFKHDDVFMTRLHLSNIKPSPGKDMIIDEVWADAEIGRKNIIIQRLKVQHDVHSLIVKGEVKNYPLIKNADLNINGESIIHLKAFKGIKLPGPIEISSGTAQVNFQVKMDKGKVEGESQLLFNDLRSNIIYSDKLTAKLALLKDEIFVSYLEMSHKKENIKISEPVIVANLNDFSSFLTRPVKVIIENLDISNALRFLGPSLRPLKGTMSGNMQFHHEKGNLFFVPENGFKITDIALIVGKRKEFEILKINEAIIKDSGFSLINDTFHMHSVIDLPRSRFEIDGYINKQGSKFSVKDGNINLEDMGNIAKVGVKGDGRLTIEVNGPLDNTSINLKGTMANFGILGYGLGNSEIDLNVSLKNSEVTIKKLESTLGKTTLSGNGFVNYGNMDISLGLNSRSANFYDLSRILDPIVKKLTFLPQDFDINAKIDAYILGKMSLKELKVKSHIKFMDLAAYGENLTHGSFNIGFADEVVSISNFEGKKENKTIQGDFSLALPSETFSLNFGWKNIALSSFNFTKKLGLNFDGNLVGSIAGGGELKDFLLIFKNNIVETSSQNYKYSDSIFDIKIMPDRVAGSIDLIGSIVQTEFDFSLSNKEKSFLKLDVDMPDIKPFVVAMIGQHLEHEDFKGKLGFILNMSFNQGFHNLDLTSTLKEVYFSHDNFKVDYRSSKPQFLIKDSKIIDWDLNFNEPDIKVVTKGSGSFGVDVSIVNEFNINSKLAELMLSPVLSAEGFLENIVRIDGKGDEYIFSAASKSAHLSLSIDGVPFPLSDVKYDLYYARNKLAIREITSSLQNGGVSVWGDVFFGGDIPDVNLKYQLQRAEIPILSKSFINVSGEGIIIGNALPYNVGGEIVINKAQIANELNDFNTKSVAQVRYLPKDQESIFDKLFELGLNVKAENSIRVVNSLMDVALRGEMRIIGSASRPRGEGRLFSPSNSSKVFFKNNEYFISNADINFSPKKEITNPDFDVQAVTNISSYRINAKAYGDLERFNFDLTSDPGLPHNSILSLIAFGYTDEIQSTLTQGEQQNLTQVGVGSFVFDRFKISDILNKQFGLQVNLGTVFEQSQTESMLSGRSQEGQGTVGRTRSATKIELKKRLDEALTLSVSSTMGGIMGQRQSMNLTYSINKKVQLEGVYELRTNAEGEEDIIDNSIGGDLKFRWTYK